MIPGRMSFHLQDDLLSYFALHTLDEGFYLLEILNFEGL